MFPPKSALCSWLFVVGTLTCLAFSMPPQRVVAAGNGAVPKNAPTDTRTWLSCSLAGQTRSYNSANSLLTSSVESDHFQHKDVAETDIFAIDARASTIFLYNGASKTLDPFEGRTKWDFSDSSISFATSSQTSIPSQGLGDTSSSIQMAYSIDRRTLTATYSTSYHASTDGTSPWERQDDTFLSGTCAFIKPQLTLANKI